MRDYRADETVLTTGLNKNDRFEAPEQEPANLPASLQRSLADEVASVESILIPKGEDMQACINGLARACGIEAPPYLKGRDERKSKGISFRYAKGIDIPNWVAEGWADAGVTGTDSIAESPRRKELACDESIGETICRYSLLVVEKDLERFKVRLANAFWDGRRSDPLIIPATRPNLLEATKGVLAVRPMKMQIRGSGELAIRLSQVRAGADLVKTGKAAKAAGLIEYKKLATVLPALVIRNSIGVGSQEENTRC